MTISVSTNKEGATALYVNNDSLSSVDAIVWHEAVLLHNAVDQTIVCFGFLSDKSVGLINYKNKEWKAEGAKVSFKVYGGKSKRSWDKETQGMKDVVVHQDELHLYQLLEAAINTEGESSVLTGTISPWVNPYYWDFAKNPQDKHRADKIDEEIVYFKACASPTLLTSSEIESFSASTNSAKKSYSASTKQESEAERIKARMDFLTIQLSDACEFKSLYDLASQIVSIAEGAEQLSADKLLELSLAKSVDLISLILGNK